MAARAVLVEVVGGHRSVQIACLQQPRSLKH